MPFTAGQRLLASQLNANMPQLLGSTMLSGSAASIVIAIPTGYNHLQGIYTARCDAATTQFLFMRLSGDSGSNYVWQRTAGQGSTAQIANNGGTATSVQIGVTPCSTDTANYFANASFSVGNISSSVFKPVSAQFTAAQSTTSGWSGTVGGLWLSTAAVTSVTLVAASGNLVAGSSMSIYGWG